MCLPAVGLAAGAIASAATAGSIAAGTGTFLGLSSAALSGIAIGAGVVSAATTTAGVIEQGQAQAKVAEANADLARQRELDARRRGSEAEAEHRTKVQRFIGAMRAHQASSGVVPDTGTGGDLLAEAAEYGEADAQRIRINADREAWGYAAEAGMYDYSGKVARTGAGYRASSTFLGGATDVIRSSPWWSRWRTP